jgi:hypothetical protein
MSAKRIFAVLLTAGMLVAAGVTIATVTVGPTYADPKPCANSN